MATHDDFTTSLTNPQSEGWAYRPRHGDRATIARYEQHAEEVPQILADRRSVTGTQPTWTYLVLRRVGAMLLEEAVPANPHPTYEAPLVPGLLVEGARFLEHDGYPAVELTVWAGGAMELIITTQLTEVTLLTVTLPAGEV